MTLKTLGRIAIGLALAAILTILLGNLFGCSQVPAYRQPDVGTETGRGYQMPWCSDLPPSHVRMPCRPDVVVERDGCVQRFCKGKEIWEDCVCRQNKYKSRPSP